MLGGRPKSHKRQINLSNWTVALAGFTISKSQICTPTPSVNSANGCIMAARVGAGLADPALAQRTTIQEIHLAEFIGPSCRAVDLSRSSADVSQLKTSSSA